MPLILITGSSTAGESTIAKELNNLGFEAYDAEKNNLSGWFNNKIKKSSKVPIYISPRWHCRHSWLIDINKVEDIASSAKNKTIILCGIARNIEQILPLCDKVIWLKMDEPTIRERVNSPTRKNKWGKALYQLEFTISRNKMLEEYFRQHNAVMIDATKSLAYVMRRTLAEVK